MSSALFLAEWTFRSSLLIGSGAFLLWVCRVKAPSIKLAAWSALLAGSFAIPIIHSAVPAISLPSWSLSIPASVARGFDGVGATAATGPALSTSTIADRDVTPVHERRLEAANGFNVDSRGRGLPFLGMTVYLLAAGILFLRLIAGLAMSVQLRHTTTPTGVMCDGIEVRESSRVLTPVTLGILRPVILLPDDWHLWKQATLDAVLAHERAHVKRRDPAVQLISLIHRTVLWHNPLSWFLHQRIVRASEEASDDAALAVTVDRVLYAEVLLGFMQRGVGLRPVGVAMARHDSPVQRIDRILDGTDVSCPPPGWIAAAVVATAVPLAYISATAQPQPAFEVADVHASVPPTAGFGRSVVQMEGGQGVRGGRYEIHNATLVDLVHLAFEVERDAVMDGPSWLALDRFDVIAKPAQAEVTSTALSRMLRSLLEDRFKLVARTDARSLPAWILSKGRPTRNLKQARASGESGCHADYDHDHLSCRNVTMDAFVEWLRAGPGTTRPVVNATGMDGRWDFDLDGIALSHGRGVSEHNPIIDAIKTQLGLELHLQSAIRPVVVVSSVNRQPTPNPVNIETLLPPPPIEFEVASIRPCETVDLRGWRSSPSGQIATGCQPLVMLIGRAWNLGPEIQAVGNRVMAAVPVDIPGTPSWLASKRFTIVAKAPVAVAQVGDANYRAMLRNLLIERFKMVTHYEPRPTDVYLLQAVQPKLKRADASRRSACRSPGVVFLGPTVITCENVTMAQFVDTLNRQMAVVAAGRPLVDETGLEGTWDVNLSYRARPAATPALGVAADPTGDVSPFEALERLGLAVEKAKRSMPAFVIDHIEPNPIEN